MKNKIIAFRGYLEIYDPCKREGLINISFAVFSYFHCGIEYRKSFKSIPYKPEMYFWKIAPETIKINEK